MTDEDRFNQKTLRAFLQQSERIEEEKQRSFAQDMQEILSDKGGPYIPGTVHRKFKAMHEREESYRQRQEALSDLYASIIDATRFKKRPRASLWGWIKRKING